MIVNQLYLLFLLRPSAVSLHEDPTFSIHSRDLLPTQEVRVYLITLRHALVRERSTYTCLLYRVCDHPTFSIQSITAHLYGAGAPKVIGPREGHAGK